MSIVPLKKITLYGCLNAKKQVLDELQHLGYLHILPLVKSEHLLDKKHADCTMSTVEALRYLNHTPQKLKQIKNAASFDPYLIEQHILQNKQHTERLQDEADEIACKIDQLTPWGHFVLPSPHEVADQQFWFYIVPHHEMKYVRMQTICAAKVQEDHLFSYVVVISKQAPEDMPGKQVNLPQEPLASLKERLEHIQFEVEQLQIERLHLTRWLELFKKNLFKLKNQAILEQASQTTYDTHTLFVLQGWMPASKVDDILEFAKKKSLAIFIEEASAEEQPPTLLENKPSLKGGEDLLSFYMTPSYWLWDPSTTIFFSFAIFFAMIFSDAGYAIMLGAVLAFFWKPLSKTNAGQRFRNVLLALTVCSLIWGILVGSYFGLSPSSKSYLNSLKIFDMHHYSSMMMLSILVGVFHLVLANLAQAWSKRRSWIAIANIGWAVVLIGAVITFVGFKYPADALKIIGYACIGIGMVAIIGFTSIEKPFWKRLLRGLMGLTRVTGMFGDVLSYLRLFALGLASASLAGVFNDLAQKIYLSMPGFKILFAVLILLIGHGINFALSLMSGFIHGLRLNFIEFFNWSLPEEGTSFKAFAKEEP